MDKYKPGFLPKLDTADPLYKKLSKQKDKKGFDDSEIWLLNETMALLLIPRLKRFIKINRTHPENLTLDEFNFKLCFILKSFEDFYLYEENQKSIFYKDNLKKSLVMLTDIWFHLKC